MHHDTAVILHLYYPELWDDIRGYLEHLGGAFDLYVSIPEGVAIPDDRILVPFPGAYIFRCENRGRDVLPFLVLFSGISELGYKYVCKIHSKKSEHIKVGLTWGQDMLGKLLGSPAIVAGIKEAFDQHAEWGIIAPSGHTVPREYFWPGNAARVQQLAKSAGISPTTDFNYVAGTMFWFRPEVLRLIEGVSVGPDDFEPEKGQRDGTLAHAFERFFGLAAAAAGWEIAESDGQAVRPAEISVHFRVIYEAYEQYKADTDQRIRMLQEQLAERNSLGRLLLSLKRLAKRVLAVDTLDAELRAGEIPVARYPALLLRAFRIMRATAVIRRSNYFDEAWYLSKYPDVASSHQDPARHYLLTGGFEGLDPGPEFSSAAYLDAYEDVRATGTNPLLHFVKNGRKEGRVPNPAAIDAVAQPAVQAASEKRAARRPGSPVRAALERIVSAVRSVYQRLPLPAALRLQLMRTAYRFFPAAYNYYTKAGSRGGPQEYSAYVPAVPLAQGAPLQAGVAFCAWLLGMKEPELKSLLRPPAWHVDALAAPAVDPEQAASLAAAPGQVQFTVLLAVNDPPAHFLRNAINSVRRQSYGRWQLEICVAESSCWNADVLAMQLERSDPRIRLRTLPVAGTGLRSAVAACEGDYVVLLSSYDELHADALQQAANAIAASPCGVIYGPADEQASADENRLEPARYAAQDSIVREELAFCQFIAWRRQLLEGLLAADGGAQGSLLAGLSAGMAAAQQAVTTQALSEPCYLFRHIPARLAAYLTVTDNRCQLQTSSVPLHVAVDAYLLGRRVSGTERYILELLQALSAFRKEANLRVSALVSSRPKFKIDGVRFVNSSRLGAIEKSDVYHKAFPARDGANLAEMALAPSVVFTPLDLILYTNQDYFPYPDEYYHYRQIMLSAARLSDRIISISNHGKMEIEKFLGIPGDKIQPIYLAVRHEHFRPQPVDADELGKLHLPENYFLYVGTDYPHKNLVTLLKAYRLVRSQARSADLVVVGLKYYARPQPELTQLLHKTFGHVHRLGHVPDEVLPALYRRATALVYPSLYEGFGLPLLEAMVCGTPVIASDATSIPEVTGEDAAVLVNGTDEKQIAAAMLQVLQDEQLRARLVEAGHKRATQFTWEKTARQTIRSYRDAVRDALSVSPETAARRKLEIIGELRTAAPTILIMSHVRFYPPAAGNEQRLFRTIKYLKKLGYRILMLVNPMSETTRLDREALKVIYQYVDYYEELGDVPVDEADEPGRDSPIGKEPILEKWRPTEAAFCPDAAMSRARALIEQYSPRILLVEYIWSSRVFAVAEPDMLKVIDTIDMFSRKNENVVKFGIQDTLAATPAEELAFINRSNLVIAIQDSEAEGFRALHPSCEVITAGIDLDVDEVAQPRAAPASPMILMVGSGNHINVHCTREFLEKAWPSIHERVPACKLKIIGKVTESLSTEDPSIELIPYVKDLDAAYASAAVVVNPVYAGTGIKVKSVEAIGHGKALVSWPEGVVGLTSGDSNPFIVIHSWQELAERVAELAGDPARRQAIEQTALQFARTSLVDKKVYRQLADRFDSFCNRRLHVLCLYLRHGTDDYPHAMDDLQAWYAARMAGADVTTWIIDNKIQQEFDGLDLDTGFRLLSGDNEHWEFSGFQKILLQHRSELEPYDVIHFVTSAFNTLYTGYLDHFAMENLQLVAHRRVCLGHIDAYDEPVQLDGEAAQSWIRTCFFFMSPESAYSIPGFVSFRQPALFFDAQGSFLSNGSLSENYKSYITAWLTGEAIQGVSWHRRTLDRQMFVRKTLAILNENMLSQQLRKAGVDLVDFYWLVNNGRQLRSSWDCPVPGWAEQIGTRGAGPLAAASSSS